MSEQNKVVVRRIVEDHWNKKNPPLVAEVFDEKATLYTPDGTLRGHEGALQLLAAYTAAFPDFRLIIDDLLVDGENVTLRWTFIGTHEGAFGVINASGKSVSVPGIAIFQIVDDKARDVRMVWDKYALLQQIGALASGAAA
jgi:steroid delta-isomerase-like uncharacterized protein